MGPNSRLLNPCSVFSPKQKSNTCQRTTCLSHEPLQADLLYTHFLPFPLLYLKEEKSHLIDGSVPCHNILPEAASPDKMDSRIGQTIPSPGWNHYSQPNCSTFKYGGHRDTPLQATTRIWEQSAQYQLLGQCLARRRPATNACTKRVTFKEWDDWVQKGKTNF